MQRKAPAASYDDKRLRREDHPRAACLATPTSSHPRSIRNDFIRRGILHLVDVFTRDHLHGVYNRNIDSSRAFRPIIDFCRVDDVLMLSPALVHEKLVFGGLQ